MISYNSGKCLVILLTIMMPIYQSQCSTDVPQLRWWLVGEFDWSIENEPEHLVLSDCEVSFTFIDNAATPIV